MKIITEDQLILLIHNVKKIKLKKGGLWDNNEIEIAYNYPIYETNKVDCLHLGPKYIVRDFRHDGTSFDIIYANCPRVIIAKNGSYNSTGVCLDCILENVKEGKINEE